MQLFLLASLFCDCLPPFCCHHISAITPAPPHVSTSISTQAHHKCQCVHIGATTSQMSVPARQAAAPSLSHYRTAQNFSASRENMWHTTPASHRALPRFQHLPVSHTNLSVVFMLLPCVTHILLSAQHSHRTSAAVSHVYIV